MTHDSLTSRTTRSGPPRQRKWPRLALTAALAFGVALPSLGETTTAQEGTPPPVEEATPETDDLAELDDDLAEQVEWLVEHLNSPEPTLSDEEAEDRFTPEFLAEVPAEALSDGFVQLAPILGEVEVGEVQPGETEHEAQVLLDSEAGIGLSVSIAVDPESGLIDLLLMEPAEDPAAAPPEMAPEEATPMATPEVSDVPPPTTEDVLPDYEEAVDAATAEGQEMVEVLLAGDGDAAFELLTEEGQAELGDGSVLEEVVAELESSRVSFALPDLEAHFDGHWDGDVISGFFTQGGVQGNFELMADEPQENDLPAGSWNGVVVGPGLQTAIAVTFSDSADDVSGTVDMPELGVAEEPLSDGMYRAEAPVEGLVQERTLVLGETNTSYTAQYEWAETEYLLDAFVLWAPDDGVAGVQISMAVPLPDDPAGDDVVPADALTEGAWKVFWGGETQLQNYHVIDPAQRHALDLVIWQDGASYVNEGLANEDYHAWGQPALAPVSGTVVTADDGDMDQPPQLAMLQGEQPVPVENPAGNHVVIETEDGSFVFFAHLQQGSVEVQEGDAIEAGEPIGLVGNSGNTTEPHIHIHAQTSADIMDPEATGIPLEFDNVLINGDEASDVRLEQEQIVEWPSP